MKYFPPIDQEARRRFLTGLQKPEVKQQIEQLHEQYAGRKVILGVSDIKLSRLGTGKGSASGTSERHIHNTHNKTDIL